MDGSRRLLAEKTIRISEFKEAHLAQWQRLCPQALQVCWQNGEVQALGL
jgi:hypothetical protein